MGSKSASPLVIVLVAGALFAAPPPELGQDTLLSEEGLDTLGPGQPAKIKPPPAPNDCGHPPRMHKCAGGVTRIRMMAEQDVPVGDPVEKYLSYKWELIDSSTIANRTCRSIPGSISRTMKESTVTHFLRVAA